MNFLIVTHGGFELVRDVWLFVSSLFGSAAFKGLLSGVFVFALTLAAASGTLETLFDLRSGAAYKWMKGMFIGIMMYSLIGPTTAQVTIYDDVSGQTQIQGNLPVGIAAVAGFVNQITIGMEDLIKTFLATPAAPEDVGYERGTEMLSESFDGAMKTALATQVAPQMWDSAYSYVQDCVAIRAARSSAYRATLDDTTDALTSWSNAANPALFTYTGLDSTGNPLTGGVPKENVSCFDAWNRMNLYFTNSLAWENTVDQFCNMMHFEASDPQSLAACKNVYEKSVQLWVLGGVAKSSQDVAKNIMLGKVWYSYLSSLDSGIEAARAAAYARVSSQLAGAGLMAQEWLPMIKVVVFVILVAITPLVFLFLITPFGLDAFKFLLGAFLWWGVWCSIDQMMLCMWLNRVDALFQAVNLGGNLGVNGLSALWPLASKSTALLGSMRGFGMLLASTLTFVIIKFGGSSFAHLAAGLGRATTAGAGPAAAAEFMSPEEAGWNRSMAAMAEYNERAQAAVASGGFGGFDFYTREDAQARVASEIANMEGYRRAGAALGTSGPVSTGRALASGVAGRQVEGVAKGGAALGAGVSNLASMYNSRYTEGMAKGQEYQGILDKVKADNPNIKSDLHAARYLANPEMAKKYGASEGFYREYTNLADAGAINPHKTSLADYAATKEALKGTMGGADVFAFAREAGDHGLTTAQAAYGKSLFNYGNALSRMESFKDTVGKGDFASAGRLLGEYQGAVEGLRSTADGLGINPAVYTEAQKVLNENTKMFVNSAVGNWLQNGKVPGGVASTLRQIADTPEGQRMLQKHLAGLEIADLSGEQAQRLNDLSEASGHGRPFKAGDTARMSVGFTGNADKPFTLSHASTVSGTESRQLDRAGSDHLPRIFVSYGGQTVKLRDATMQRTGNKVTMEGTDSSGNRRRISGFVDPQLSGSGKSASDSMVLTGAEWEYTDSGGTGRVKSGLMGETPISSMLARNLDSAASFIGQNVKNDADAQAVAKQFARELPADVKSSRDLAGRLTGQLTASGGVKIPFLKKAGISGRLIGELGKINKDSTNYDLVQAFSQEILDPNNGLSPKQQATALQGLRSWVLETQSDLVGGKVALEQTPGEVLNPQVSRVAPALKPVLEVAGQVGGFVANVGGVMYQFTGDTVKSLGAFNRDLNAINMQAKAGTLPGLKGANERMSENLKELTEQLPKILHDAGYSVKEGASASIVAVGDAAKDISNRLSGRQNLE